MPSDTSLQPRAPKLSYLFIDLELGRDGRFHAMAARRDGVERVWTDARFETAHAELATWVQAGDVLVGHNLHRHDRPAIKERAAASPLLELPTLDTLELSVLAFPRRPYHALVKDDKLVRDSLPNPLSDVRASERVLNDSIRALAKLPDQEKRTLAALISNLAVEEPATRGWRLLLESLGWPCARGSHLDLRSDWAGRVCQNSPLLQKPHIDMPLIMVAAWLRIAQHCDGSVLPAWVRRTWPSTPGIARALRAVACQDPDCDWCTTNLSPDHWLHDVFGPEYEYRSPPTDPDGRSLQRTLVERGLRGESTFGILPTGGGKSLCFQVPAEAWHRILGQLTVVISPLQSLMKDQVDSLAKRLPHARAIYSGLPALMRPEVMNEVRSGECGLLYLSPEQFRNIGILKMLAQRELGAIVFDEAHCLSQWGHDFRTDYPYVLRAVREMLEGQGASMPPVYLFTATVQADAARQILAHAEEQSGRQVLYLDGGSARENLTYRVQQVPQAQRMDIAVGLLEEHLQGGGSAIVFCGSRRGTETVAAELTDRGFPARAYHAGLKPDERRELQDEFLAGMHRIITATNAFGMGVDKADVRLVLHFEMPSSLESYVQEAGRAGRDNKPATAVLLWAPGDAEPRFALGATSDLAVEDLQVLWRAIRQLPAEQSRGLEYRIVTPRELLFQESMGGRFDAQDEREETRVKAGVNWLERAKVLSRKENHTRVFTGRPRLASLAEAEAHVEALELPPYKTQQWKTVLKALYDAGEEGLSADDLAVLCHEMTFDDPIDGGNRVLSILNQMSVERLITSGQTFSAFVSKGVTDSSSARLVRWRDREATILEKLEEDGLDDSGLVHLRAVADRLTSSEAACTANDVAMLLGTWSSAGWGKNEKSATAQFRHQKNQIGRLHLEIPLGELEALLRLRQAVAARALSTLLDLANGSGKQLLVASELEHLVDAVEQDLELKPELRSIPDAVRGAVSWMHELRIITVQNGLAVFRSAMRLDRDPKWPSLQDAEAREATAALNEHQAQKILRIHVMDAWAREMLDNPERAERLRADWFALPIEEFKAKWFARQRARIERPTTPESYHSIVTSLKDLEQEAIVTRDTRRNHLVLAGPGSGKTRILVHRVAWLLRCQRVRARQILVVCYTRNNALELRRRLSELVGRDANRVVIQTLHGVALSMVGAHRLGPDGDLTLDTCIPVAAAMLRGEALDTGEQTRQRDALLSGFNYLFIDEYQDIDAPKYELLSALAGRAMDGAQRKLRVFAVGDDDQAIYTFDGARTDFIRNFEEDYQASRFVVSHNYRNPKCILRLGQDVVEPLPNRLKADATLGVNPDRKNESLAGPWADKHAQLNGHMVWHRAPSVSVAAHAAMAVVRRWIDDGVEPEQIGVLSRERPRGLHRLRIAAEQLKVPFSWPLPSGDTVPIHRIREVTLLMELLDEEQDFLKGTDLQQAIDGMEAGPWRAALHSWLEPHRRSQWPTTQWRYDLLTWIRLERRARTIGSGIHLGTMHSAKGMEFEHVLLLDDGTMADTEEDRRLLYVAITRAKRSLQLFSTDAPSPVFATLSHPLLKIQAASAPAKSAARDHGYGLLGRDAIWLDWLGRQRPDHEGNTALAEAKYGDRFTIEIRGKFAAIVDQDGRDVAMLSAAGRNTWLPRLDQDLRLRLLAVTREWVDEPQREAAYREKLQVARWWTGIWEARWRE